MTKRGTVSQCQGVGSQNTTHQGRALLVGKNRMCRFEPERRPRRIHEHRSSAPPTAVPSAQAAPAHPHEALALLQIRTGPDRGETGGAKEIQSVMHLATPVDL